MKRLVSASNPESGTIIYSYDTSGNLSTRTDANGTKLSFSAYDGMNRATGKSYTLGTSTPGAPVASTPSVSYAYGDAQTSCNPQRTLDSGDREQRAQHAERLHLL